MTDRDVMTLLAAANPVRADELPETDQTVESILARRRRPSSRAVLVAAAVLAAVAAGLIGVFAVGGHGAKPGLGRVGPGALGSNSASWQTIALSDASSALGVPVVLPNTDFVQPSDAAPQARTEDCSASACTLFVSFPAQSLGVRYTRPAPFADPRAQWAADVRTAPEHHAEAQLVDLNGVPGDYIDYPGVKRLVEFVIGGTWIVVGGAGNYDESTLQVVAQSIVDRSGSTTVTDGPGSLPTVEQPLPTTAKQVSLDDATAAIGRPIVLPNTSAVSPSDAGAVWVNGALPAVSAAVTFPSPGVFIQYTLPPPRDPTATYRAIAQQDPAHFSTIDVNGGTALAGKQNPDDENLGALIFVLNGVEIRIFGPFDESALQTIAQSIVDRSK